MREASFATEESTPGSLPSSNDDNPEKISLNILDAAPEAGTNLHLPFTDALSQ